MPDRVQCSSCKGEIADCDDDDEVYFQGQGLPMLLPGSDWSQGLPEAVTLSQSDAIGLTAGVIASSGGPGGSSAAGSTAALSVLGGGFSAS